MGAQNSTTASVLMMGMVRAATRLARTPGAFSIGYLTRAGQDETKAVEQEHCRRMHLGMSVHAFAEGCITLRHRSSQSGDPASSTVWKSFRIVRVGPALRGRTNRRRRGLELWSLLQGIPKHLPQLPPRPHSTDAFKHEAEVQNLTARLVHHSFNGAVALPPAPSSDATIDALCCCAK